ncbi:hypothetical protein K8I85_16310 [bacterium]|nr:hypothetical protein [bacterium]
MMIRKLGHGRLGLHVAGILAAGALFTAAATDPPCAVVEGGRLSRVCRAGLWVMGTGHVGAGALLMWLGC